MPKHHIEKYPQQFLKTQMFVLFTESAAAASIRVWPVSYTHLVLIDIDQNYPPDTKDNLLILPFFTSGFSIELPEVFLFFPDLS